VSSNGQAVDQLLRSQQLSRGVWHEAPPGPLLSGGQRFNKLPGRRQE